MATMPAASIEMGMAKPTQGAETGDQTTDVAQLGYVLGNMAHATGMALHKYPSIAEMCTGCEFPNKYSWHMWDPTRPASKEDWEAGAAGLGELGYAKEDSGFCARQVCGPGRGFTMTIGPPKTIADPEQWKAANDYITVVRPFKCTFLCFNRPIIKVSHARLGDLCEIVCPFRLCDMEAVVRKPSWPGCNPSPTIAALPDEWFRIKGSWCQGGVLLPLPCGSCRFVDLQVYGAEGSMDADRVLGEITHINPGCCGMVAGGDHGAFTIKFPTGITVEQKASLAITAMFLDYCFFEKRSGNSNNK